MILRELTLNDEPAFLEGFQAYAGEAPTWYTFTWTPGTPWAEHIELLRKNKLGLDIPADRVPDSILYAFIKNKIVGRVSIRHELNDYLKERGGHPCAARGKARR